MEDSVVVLSPTTLFTTPLNTDFKSCARAFPAAAVMATAMHRHLNVKFIFLFILAYSLL